MSVILKPLPKYQSYRVLVGTAVRKSPVILRAYLQTLAWQEYPKGVYPTYCFVADTDDPEVLDLLHAFVAEHGGQVLTPGKGPNDTDDSHPVTHQWTGTGMARVGEYKNLIFQKAQDLGVDAIWLVDADLLLDKTTFASLWSQRAPIACAVYWTHWHNPGLQAGKMCAAPQVWLDHPYELQGRGYETAEFRARLVNKERTQVWGQGACTLIKRDVIDKGVSFDYIDGVSREGMMAGEDRHFCLRAEGLHVPMYADPWPDIFHVYHPDDVELIPEMLERLGTPHQERPKFGDWVNVVLEPVEPVPTGPNTSQHFPPVWYRGRLGNGDMLPELEDAVAGMCRNDTRTVGVHFPAHFPEQAVRLQRRLVRVTLVDTKPWAFPPVLERELMHSDRTGATVDRTTLSSAQQDAMKVDV